MRKFLSLLSLTLLVGVFIASAGCGNVKAKDQELLLAGDAGVACMMIPLKAPEQVPAALDALQCAKTLLTGAQIDLDAVARCTDRAGVKAKYARLVSAALVRVKVHTGAGPVVPQDSDAARALNDFFSTCEIFLG